MYVWAYKDLQSYKSQSPLQMEIFRLKKISLFKNYNERLVWTTKLFSCNCDITKIGEQRAGVEHCMFQNRNPVRVFLYHCISEGNWLSSENDGCHFHFILHVMSDKAAFVRGALLCLQHYHGNLDLSHSNSGSYMPPQIVFVGLCYK